MAENWVTFTVGFLGLLFEKECNSCEQQAIEFFFYLYVYKKLDLAYKKIMNQHCVLFVMLDKVRSMNCSDLTHSVWLC